MFISQINLRPCAKYFKGRARLDNKLKIYKGKRLKVERQWPCYRLAFKSVSGKARGSVLSELNTEEKSHLGHSVQQQTVKNFLFPMHLSKRSQAGDLGNAWAWNGIVWPSKTDLYTVLNLKNLITHIWKSGDSTKIIQISSFSWKISCSGNTRPPGWPF